MKVKRSRLKQWVMEFFTLLMVSAASPAAASSMVVNLSCGYLYGEGGTGTSDRLHPGTLCVLVADLDGDGFDPPSSGWVSGDDVLVRVSDGEYPQAAGGTQGFDLASGSTEPGLFSRSLRIDFAQFGGRTAPVPLTLRWFPRYRAADVNLSTTTPAEGTPFGEFRRAVPLYPEAGTVSWLLPLQAGANVSLDPFATTEFGGVDAAAAGTARWLITTGVFPREFVVSGTAAARTYSFRGSQGRRYAMQRSTDLATWTVQETITAASDAPIPWQDPAPVSGSRAFYRVVGPLPES